MEHYKVAYCQLMRASIQKFLRWKNLNILCNNIIYQYQIYRHLFSRKCLFKCIPEMPLARNFVLDFFPLRSHQKCIHVLKIVLEKGLNAFLKAFGIFFKKNLCSVLANRCSSSIKRPNNIFLETSWILYKNDTYGGKEIRKGRIFHDIFPFRRSTDDMEGFFVQKYFISMIFLNYVLLQIITLFIRPIFEALEIPYDWKLFQQDLKP